MFAIDLIGSKAVVERIQFTVIEQDVKVAGNGPNNKTCMNGIAVDGIRFDSSFTCNCNSTAFDGDNCEDVRECERDETLNLATGVCIKFDLVHSATIRSQTGTLYTDPTTMMDTFYAVGDTYKLAPLQLLNSTIPSIGEKSAIQYAINGPAPDGMFAKASTGEILVSFSEDDVGDSFDIELEVVDEGGARVSLEIITMQVKYRDLEDVANRAAFGPNGNECDHGIMMDDTNEFDGKYTCDCFGLNFKGTNCEIPIKLLLNCDPGFALVDGKCELFNLHVNTNNKRVIEHGSTTTSPIQSS